MIASMMSKMQIVAIPRNAPVAVSARFSFGMRCSLLLPRLVSLFPVSHQASVRAEAFSPAVPPCVVICPLWKTVKFLTALWAS